MCTDGCPKHEIQLHLHVAPPCVSKPSVSIVGHTTLIPPTAGLRASDRRRSLLPHPHASSVSPVTAVCFVRSNPLHHHPKILDLAVHTHVFFYFLSPLDTVGGEGRVSPAFFSAPRFRWLRCGDSRWCFFCRSGQTATPTIWKKWASRSVPMVRLLLSARSVLLSSSPDMVIKKIFTEKGSKPAQQGKTDLVLVSEVVG